MRTLGNYAFQNSKVQYYVQNNDCITHSKLLTKKYFFEYIIFLELLRDMVKISSYDYEGNLQYSNIDAF